MLERPGSKAKKVGHEYALDERRVGRSLLITPTAARSVRYRSSAGLRRTMKPPNNGDPLPDGLPSK